ncbi:MAG TPA: HAMP domain-containing sensor histidine kinase [Acidimicrobiales bacterium]
MSLRGRLLIALLALVAAGLALSDLATYKTLQRFLVRRVDQQLVGVGRGARIAINRLNARPPADANAPPGFGRAELYAQLRDASGRVVHTYRSPTAETSTPAIPRQLPRDRGRGVDLTVGSEQPGGPSWRLRVLTVPSTQGAVPPTQQSLVLALPMRDVHSTLHDLVLIELTVSAGVLIAAGGLGLWLVRLGLRPLDEIETTAEAIAAGDLARRVPEASTRTEVGRLAVAINAMLSQIEGAFAERQASEDRLRRFVADASHELRTPLTSIRGYAELFRRGANHRPDDLAKAMNRIEAEAVRMGVLVDDLLLLARLDRGLPLLRTPVDLTRVAMEAAEAAQVVDHTRPLAVQTNGPVTVLGDPARLRQVADNLLANVRTHTPEGTHATVRVSAREGTAVLEVSDDGPGVSPDQATRIFERFYRADTGRSREHGGSGLGLAIVDSIVSSLGGKTNVTSESGHGATFRVELPLTQNPAND